MLRRFSNWKNYAVMLGLTLDALFAAPFAAAQTGAEPSTPPTPAPAATRADESPPPPPPTRPDPLELLMDELESLRAESVALRQQLAQARLDAQQSQRELAELRQFITDHQQLGADFSQYRAVKEIAEREARRKAAVENRQKRDAEKAQRKARMDAARAEKNQRDTQASQVGHYRRQGFTPLGLDVFAGKMAFFYEAKDTNRTRVDYDPLIGTYLRPLPSGSEIDYSTMTISGSVLNAADELRNIGVAITFFDENGNQVGHETVQINNARPDVPYPFTSKIDMALNRPFDSSSTYVLYADAAETEPAENVDGSP